MSTLSPSARALAPWLLLAGLASPRAAELPPEVEEELDRLAEVFEGYEEFTATYAMRRDGEEGVLTIGREDEWLGLSMETDGEIHTAMYVNDGMVTLGSTSSDHPCWSSFDLTEVFDEQEATLEALAELGLDVEVGHPRPELHVHVNDNGFDVTIVWGHSSSVLCTLGPCRHRYEDGGVDGQVTHLQSGRATLTLDREKGGMLTAIRVDDDDEGLELIELEDHLDLGRFEVESDGCEDHSAGLRLRFADTWRTLKRKSIHAELSTGLQDGVFDLSDSEDEVLELFELWYEPILNERFEGWPDQLSTWVVETAGRIDELAGDDADSRERQVEMLEKQTTETLESAAQSAFGSLEGGWDHFREDDLLELEAEAARRVFERIVSEPVLLTLEGQIDWLLDR